MSLIDLSHTFTADMPVWPGDSRPEVTQQATIKNDGYSKQIIKTSFHIGTHLDAPAHMIPEGKKISELPVSQFCGRGILLNAVGKREIGASLLNNFPGGEIVLVHTGWSKKFGRDEYYNDFPKVSESFARKITSWNVKLVGLDTPSPDLEPFTIHKILLGKGVLIIENLTNLESLVGVTSFEVFAFPVKFTADGSPVRVVAKAA